MEVKSKTHLIIGLVIHGNMTSSDSVETTDSWSVLSHQPPFSSTH